jgi:hypothetical protein
MTGRTQPIPKDERGAAMLAALCLAMVFAICLSSYMALCYTSLKMSTRGLMNEHCSELAETGIEQALYARGNGDWTGWAFSGNVYTIGMTMTTSGLVASGSGPTPMNLGNGTTGTVNITVDESNAGIVKVYSTAQVALPDGSPAVSQTLAFDPSQPPTHDPSNSLNQPTTAPLFVNAVAALSGTVAFSSAGTVDSYNSNMAPGTYSAPTNTGYSAVITSQNTSSVGSTVLLNNAVVSGYAVGYSSTSPSSSNWLSYASNGKIIGPGSSPSTFVDSSRILNSPQPYQPMFLDNRPPWSGNLPPSTYDGAMGTNVMDISCTLGDPAATATSLPVVYQANAIMLNNAVLTIVGPVVLEVYGNVAVTGTGQIQLSGQFASLQIFMDGNMNIAGQGIANLNPVPLPKRFSILSTHNTNTHNILFSPPSTVPFYGVIYLPFQTVKVQSDAVIYGSIVGGSVLFTGNPTIHYDMALRSPDLTPCDAAFAYLSAPMVVSGVVASVAP